MALDLTQGRSAVFLDKDGTLVEDVPFNVDPARVRLTRGAGPALARLAEAGHLLVVVSNQSGVARGLFTEEALVAVRETLSMLLAASGVPLTGFYFCPHHPQGTCAPYAVACSCRKPAPGMILLAARELGIDLRRSWLIGDILDDIEAGRRSGCRTVLLDNGNETEWRLTACRQPHATATDLQEAASFILESDPFGGVARLPPAHVAPVHVPPTREAPVP
jgi:histidinol-phosphate phosphatase family protein